jgi:pimeloyl-[acyl-carrier protein] methyl ester esterase
LQSPFFPTTAKPVTLVLLPGMDGTGVLFEPFVAALGNEHPVTVMTYPTSGDSQTYAGLHDLAALALPSEGPLVLLGESFSGPIAISLAAANPTRVAGVVLCCTFVRNPRPGLRWLSGLASMPAPLPPSSILSALLFGRFATPRLSLMLRDALAKVQPAVLRARLRAIVSVDVRAQARALEVPVLYLKGASDRLVPPPAVVEAEQYCRDMKVQSFDAPHCLLQVVPEEAAAAVADFIEKVAAP